MTQQDGADKLQEERKKHRRALASGWPFCSHLTKLSFNEWICRDEKGASCSMLKILKDTGQIHARYAPPPLLPAQTLHKTL